MLSDYHIHSKFSSDSNEEPEAIVNQAINLGMNSICFTDHQDFIWPVPNENFDLNAPEYFKTINELKEKYENEITILAGVEIGLTSSNVSNNRVFLIEYPFEYVIGSCHIVDNMDPYYSEFWNNRNDLEAFELYFNTLLNALIEFNSFNTLGHLDYIVRYSPNKDSNYSPSDYYDVVDEIFKIIISKNIALEINTGALYKGMPFPNPHLDFLARYKELGGQKVAVGSDAHTKDKIGYGFETVAAIIQKYGFIF